MAKTITISDEVYQLLKKLKMPGESFSDVIRRSLARGVRLTDIYGSGTITKADWTRFRKTIHESEEITRRRIANLKIESH